MLPLRQITWSESSEDTVTEGFVARSRVGLPLDEPKRAKHRYYALSADDVRAAFDMRFVRRRSRKSSAGRPQIGPT